MSGDKYQESTEKINFKCDIKICLKEDEGACSNTPDCDVQQCSANSCDARKRRSIDFEARQQSFSNNASVELQTPISVPVVSSEDCKTQIKDVCIEMKAEQSELSCQLALKIFPLVIFLCLIC